MDIWKSHPDSGIDYPPGRIHISVQPTVIEGQGTSVSLAYAAGVQLKPTTYRGIVGGKQI